MLENPIVATVTGVELIILAAAMGAVAGNLWILASELNVEAPQLANARRRLWSLLGLCLIGFTLGSGIELLLRTASMSDHPLLESLPEIGTVLFKTHYGHLWWWRCAAVIVMWIAWILHRRKNLCRVMSAAAFIALIVICLLG